MGILDPAGHLDLGQRGRFPQTAADQDDVFHGHPLAESKRMRVVDLSLHRNRIFFPQIVDIRNVNPIQVLQRDVRLSADDLPNVERDHRIIVRHIHPGDLSPRGELAALQPFGFCDQLRQCRDFFGKFVLARTPYGSFDRNHVRIHRQHLPDAHAIAVQQLERPEIGFIHRQNGQHPAALAVHRHIVAVSVPGKTAPEIDQPGQRLAVFHVVNTLPLDLSPDRHVVVIRRHDDHIVVFQPDIRLVFPVDQVVVHIQIGDLLAVPENLNMPERPDPVDPAGRIDRIEQRRQRRQRISPRSNDLPGNIDLDTANLPQRHLHLSVHDLVNPGFDPFLGFGNRQSGQIDRADPLDADTAFRGNFLLYARFRLAPDFDDHLVAGSQHVIGRSGHVVTRRESQVLRRKYLLSENGIPGEEIGRTALVGGLISRCLLLIGGNFPSHFVPARIRRRARRGRLRRRGRSRMHRRIDLGIRSPHRFRPLHHLLRNGHLARRAR